MSRDVRRLRGSDEWGDTMELGQPGAVRMGGDPAPPDPARGQLINEAVWLALTECNSGKPMATWEDWLKVGQRIGIRRIEFHDRDVVPIPLLRFDDATTKATAVLYLLCTRDRHHLYFWLLHEFSEVIMLRDLRAPLWYPSEWGDHHDMAQLVEMHHQEPIAPLESLPADCH